MKCVFLILAAFLSGAPLAAKDKAVEAKILFQHAQALSSLDDAGPYHLIAVVRDESGAVVAKLEREQLSKDEWKSETEIGSYTSTVLQSDNKLWRSESRPYEPYVADQLWAAVRPGFVLVERAKLSSKPGASGAAKLRCVEVTFGTSCFDEKTGLLVTRDGTDSRVLFSDYQPFGAKQIARSISLVEGRGRKVTISVQVAEAPELTPGMFKPSASMQEDANCKVAKPPRAQYSPDPIYPKGEHGDVLVVTQAWIGTDGRIVHIEVIRTPNGNFAKAVSAALSTWKFSPAMCGDTPKEQKIMIEINMRDSSLAFH
jgi:hypothetical protein